MGGYLGVMAKLGPFCKRDNCSLVRGVLERLITHLSMWLVHVWLVLDGGSPGAGWVAAAWVEGVGAMGVAGTLEVVEVEVELVENLDILFVSLTFLSDLMKRLQYGCQQKLVNHFIMILLCFQHFIQHVYKDSNLISTFLFLMVSTHVYPKYPPLLIYNKSYTSVILVSFFYFIC